MPKILIADDEPLIRQMLTLVLENEGFSVISAANGVQALLRYRLYGNDIELVISDIMMPEMSGTSLAKRLLSERPDLPIILMSDQVENIDLCSHPTVRFLAKPFNLESLLSNVRSLIMEGCPIPTVSHA